MKPLKCILGWHEFETIAVAKYITVYTDCNNLTSEHWLRFYQCPHCSTPSYKAITGDDIAYKMHTACKQHIADWIELRQLPPHAEHVTSNATKVNPKKRSHNFKVILGGKTFN